MKKLNIRNVMKGAAALMAGALLFTACNTPEGGKSETREPAATREIWTAQQANDWYANQPWYVGSNFLPVRRSTSWKCGSRKRLIQQPSIRSWGWHNRSG